MNSLPALNIPADKLLELQAEYAKELQALWQQGLQKPPVLKDRRFANDAWQHNPSSAYTAALYLLNARTMMAFADSLDTDEKTRARIRFAVEQWAAASSPRCLIISEIVFRG